MKSPFLLFCFLSLVTLVTVPAAAINFDTGGAHGHVFATYTSDNLHPIGTISRLPAGSIVSLGTTTDGTPGSFAEFARTTISNTGGGSTALGFLRHGVTIATQAEADAIKGKQIYLYVFNTTDPAQLATTRLKGLFTSEEWQLPDNFDAAATTSYNIRLGGTNRGTSPTAPLSVFASDGGDYRIGTITLGDSPNNSNTIASIYLLPPIPDPPPIPEPSTAVLGAFVAIAAMSRRRTRRLSTSARAD